MSLTHRTSKKPQPDRISTLSNSLIAHILSFLPTTEEAVRTSILSKRWLHLWTYLPNLLFRYRRPETRLETFSYFVNKTLSQHSCAVISSVEFDLDYNCASQLGPLLGVWIRCVMAYRVEKLTIDFDDSGDFKDNARLHTYSLPQFFYTNNSFREFKARHCCFAPRGEISWNSVRVLEIGVSKLSDEVVGKVLAGCSALESLTLYQCVGISRLEIASKSLKKLVVADIRASFSVSADIWDWSYVRELDPPLMISCPNVEFLEILGSWHRKFKLVNTLGLVSADLRFVTSPHMLGPENYHEECRTMVMDALKMVSHVEELKIGTFVIKVLSEVEVKAVPAPLFNCRCLVLQIVNRLLADHFPAVVCLLRNSSRLEKLIIDGSGWGKFSEGRTKYHQNGDVQISQKKIFDHLSSPLQLKIIEISDLELSSREYELLKFLFKNAVVLEKVAILQHGAGRLDEMVQMRNKLLSFPRASPRLSICIPDAPVTAYF